MAYHPILYKLLGVPDRGSEPSYYELLGLKPHQCTTEFIQDRLVECKKRLRQNIPRPEFIPIVSLWEQDLDRSAETLADSQERAKYNARLSRSDQDPQHLVERAERAQQARKIIESVLSADGTLEDTKQSAVAKQLRLLQIPRDQVESSLAEIPRPTPATEGLLAETLPFFERAVDLHLNHGFLTARDERALLRLAERLRMSGEAAAQAIENRLSARGARRTGISPPAIRTTKARQTPKPPSQPPVAPAEPAKTQPAQATQPPQTGESTVFSQAEPISVREFISYPDEESREPLKAWPFALAGAVAGALLLLAFALGAFEGCDVGDRPRAGSSQFPGEPLDTRPTP